MSLKQNRLTGEEVDVLIEHLRNMLNLMNGNITHDEYLKLEENVLEKIYGNEEENRYGRQDKKIKRKN